MLPRPRITTSAPSVFTFGAREQFANARRRAGLKTRRVAQHQLADVHRMKTVHVLLRQNGGIDHRFADVFRQRRLHQNSVQPRIGVQFLQQREQFSLAGRFRQNVRFGKNAEFGAGLFLAPDINLGRRVFADAHEREARPECRALSTPRCGRASSRWICAAMARPSMNGARCAG